MTMRKHGLRATLALCGAVLLVLSLGPGATAAPPPGTPAEEGLQQEVELLQEQVDTLSSGLEDALERIEELEADLAAVEANDALALGPHIEVQSESVNDVAGPNIVFSGANLHLRSGSGTTDDNVSSGGTLTGLGNLIIGYNELPTPNWETPDEDPIKPGYRSGSHNLVLGTKNSFYGSGGLVGGHSNAIYDRHAAILTGSWSTASGGNAVLGGFSNEADGWATAVVGGQGNRTVGGLSSILGGIGNDTPAVVPPPAQAATYATVVGGSGNEVTGFQSVAVGGFGNKVSGDQATTVWGWETDNTGRGSVVSWGRWETSSTDWSWRAGDVAYSVEAAP